MLLHCDTIPGTTKRWAFGLFSLSDMTHLAEVDLVYLLSQYLLRPPPSRLHSSATLQKRVGVAM